MEKFKDYSVPLKKPVDLGYRSHASRTYCWGVFPLTAAGEGSLSGVESVNYETITIKADKGTAIQQDVLERHATSFGVRWFKTKRSAEHWACSFSVGLCAVAKRFQ